VKSRQPRVWMILLGSLWVLATAGWAAESARVEQVRRERQPVADLGSAFDLQGFVDKAIQAGLHHIAIPPGRYRVTPRHRQHLVLQDRADVHIVADGVEMICTETTRALTLSNCRHVTLRGLTIDYDPLPYTQGRIVKLSENNTVHDIELFDGYPRGDQVQNFKYEIFRPDTRTLRFGSYHEFRVVAQQANRIRVTRGGRYHGEKVGDIQDNHGGRYHPNPRQIGLVSENGGYGVATPGHDWPCEIWTYRSYDPETGGTMDAMGRGIKGDRLPRLDDKSKAWFTRVVAEMCVDLWAQKDTHGMTGQFFCQLYDTESECDGLVSYDRAVCKVDYRVIRAVATGQLSQK